MIEPLETLQAAPLAAYRINWPERIRANGFDPALDGGVASWVIDAPWAHPVWSRYWLHIVHLRPIDRGDGPIETKFYLPEATHELWLYALNPDAGTSFEIATRADNILKDVLTPKNYADQLKLDSDEEAVLLARSLASEVLNGHLNPDTDAMGQWISRFGGHMLKEEFRR